MSFDLESFINKRISLFRSSRALDKMYDILSAVPTVGIDQLVLENAVLIVVDMVKGFAVSGARYSPNIAGISGHVAEFARACEQKGIPIASLTDSHSLSSPEFGVFPPHCLADNEEAELIEPLASLGSITELKKNSTNGFLSSGLKDWIKQNASDTFVIVGCCTDISVMQLALTLKAWYNERNRTSRVIVPTALVATYELGTHNAALTELMALYNMSINGVEICSDIALV